MNEIVIKLCNKLITKFKEKPYLYSAIFLVALLAIPIVIWFAYFLGKHGFVLINTSLTEDGAFGFYGSFLAFLGTVCLGLVSVWQNNQANITNRKIQQDNQIINETNFQNNLKAQEQLQFLNNLNEYIVCINELLPDKDFFTTLQEMYDLDAEKNPKKIEIRRQMLKVFFITKLSKSLHLIDQLDIFLPDDDVNEINEARNDVGNFLCEYKEFCQKNINLINSKEAVNISVPGTYDLTKMKKAFTYYRNKLYTTSQYKSYKEETPNE